MKRFINFLLIYLGITLIANLWLPTVFTHPLFDRNPDISQEFRTQIEQTHPKAFIIGNSLVARGLDILRLENLTGYKILKADRGGSASALWYLIFKNNIAVAQFPPPYVIFVFKDNIFSIPGVSVEGKYRKEIDEFAGANEQLLNQLAYLNFMSPVEYFADKTDSLFRYNDTLRTQILNTVKYLLIEKVFGLTIDNIDDEIDNVFRVEALDPKLLTAIQQESDLQDQLLYRNYDFYGSLPGSFLPAIMQIAEEKNIRLIFVRYRARHYVEYPHFEPETEAYFDSMKKYLTENGAFFIDFSADERIQLKDFAEGDHLNGNGNIIFTEMMAEALTIIIGDK
jgi:hypothetical protein